MDKVFTYKAAASEILPAINIARVMGYDENDVPEPFAGIIKESVAHANSLLEARAFIRIVHTPVFENQNHKMMVQEQEFCLENVVFNMLKRSASVAFFICTIGPDLPEVIHEQSADGDLLAAYVYDILGTLSVESAMDVFQAKFKAEMAGRQLNITNRYSPGYCNWDIKEQELLFKVTGDDFTGVKLSTSCLMQPIKSISGIIGIGENVKFNRYTCSRCDQKDCLYASIKADGRAGVI